MVLTQQLHIWARLLGTVNLWDSAFSSTCEFHKGNDDIANSLTCSVTSQCEPHS